jgi:hypothetical protein
MAIKTGISPSDLQRRWTNEDYNRVLMVIDVRARDAMWRAGEPVKPYPYKERES